jgi:hypothetical protein
MPAPAPGEPAPPRTELQELQLKATEKTDEVRVLLFQTKFPSLTTFIVYFSP